jgi:hypothetical protein
MSNQTQNTFEKICDDERIFFVSPEEYAVVKKIANNKLGGEPASYEKIRAEFVAARHHHMRQITVGADIYIFVDSMFEAAFKGTPEDTYVAGYLDQTHMGLPPEDILSMLDIEPMTPCDQSSTAEPVLDKVPEVEAIFEDIEVMNPAQRLAFENTANNFRVVYMRRGYSKEAIDDVINEANEKLGKDYSPRRGFSQLESFI